MPVFEFRCRACGKKYSALVGMTADSSETKCPHCGSLEGDRLVSRFARVRSEDARLDEMADRLETFGEPESNAEMRQMARELGKAMDDDMADEMEEMFEADLEGGGDEE